MDAARGLCVGIDGVSLERCAVGPHPAQSVSATMRSLMGPALLERPWDSVRPTSSSVNIVSTTARLSAAAQAFNVTLKVVGLPEGSKDWGLEINGESLGSFSATALALGVPVVVGSG